MEEKSPSNQAPLILGRSFLTTARTKINVYKGTLSMEFGDNMVRFNIFDTLKHPEEEHAIFKLEILNILVQEAFPHLFMKNAINQTLQPKIGKKAKTG